MEKQPFYDKVHVSFIPDPPLGVWRDITQPDTPMDICKVWKAHIDKVGASETKVLKTQQGYQLQARRMK